MMGRGENIVGTNIRGRREAMGMTQSQLAERSGLNVISISNIERGRQARKSNLDLIAKALSTTPEALQTPKAEPKPNHSDLYALAEHALSLAQVPGLNRALALTIASGDIGYFDRYCDEARLTPTDREAAVQLSQALLIRLKAAK